MRGPINVKVTFVTFNTLYVCTQIAAIYAKIVKYIYMSHRISCRYVHRPVFKI